MLSKQMYTEEYIRSLQSRTGNDPALLERVVYAFGLLEAIRRVGLPFCFKGGTSLMLLLEHPRRLSTDIDIIVDPGTDIDSYIRRQARYSRLLMWKSISGWGETISRSAISNSNTDHL